MESDRDRIIDRMAGEQGDNQPYVVATVVRTEDSTAGRPGDKAIIRADGTGIASIPRGEAAAVLAMAQAFDANDRESWRLIEGGMSLSEAMKRFDTI